MSKHEQHVGNKAGVKIQVPVPLFSAHFQAICIVNNWETAASNLGKFRKFSLQEKLLIKADMYISYSLDGSN